MGRKRKPDKSPRKRVHELGLSEQQKLHNTLALAIMRARTVQLHSHDLISHAANFDQMEFMRALVSMNATLAIRGHQAAWLYFACAEVVIELWEARGFSDSTIDKMINDRKRRGVLTGMRDVVFHGLELDEPRMTAFYEQWDDIEGWTTPIIDAMALYTRTWYGSYLNQINTGDSS